MLLEMLKQLKVAVRACMERSLRRAEGGRRDCCTDPVHRTKPGVGEMEYDTGSDWERGAQG
jgi:hypothetical protein